MVPPATSKASDLHKESKHTATSNLLPTRAQMEIERLARQRVRSGHAAMEEPPIKRAKPDVLSSSAPDSRHFTDKPTSTSKFWNGRLLTTGHPSITHSYRDVTFEECMGPKNEMRSALLLSLTAEASWLYPKLPCNVPVHLAVHGTSDLAVELKGNIHRYHITVPSGRGCMHIKCMLFFYPTFLRVCISTANLVAIDWDHYENAVYIQDFPITGGRTLGGSSTSTAASPSEFRDVLLDVFKSCTVLPLHTYQSLESDYDFSKAGGVRLIFSKWGSHNDNAPKYGYWRYRQAVADLGLRKASKEDVHLECQGSSIGFYTQPWLKQLHGAAGGRAVTEDIHSKVSVLFPTTNTVKQSRCPNGGSMFCKQSSFAGNNKRMFKNVLSKKDRVLMHAKLILSLYKRDRKLTRGHVYVGSHNFTPAAWGQIQKGNLEISNMELGVLIPLDSPLMTYPGEKVTTDGIDLERRADQVALWQRPLESYGSEQPFVKQKHGD